jgi:hypothetical protein
MMNDKIGVLILQVTILYSELFFINHLTLWQMSA